MCTHKNVYDKTLCNKINRLQYDSQKGNCLPEFPINYYIYEAKCIIQDF